MIKEETVIANNCKPCKVCGHKPMLKWFSLYFDENDWRYSIICSNDQCSNNVSSERNLNLTIKKWNEKNEQGND